MTDLTKIIRYKPGKMPARNLFLNNYHEEYWNKNIPQLRCLEKAERDHIVNCTSRYIYEMCDCVIMAAKDRPDVILSYIFYVKTPDKPVLYYARTKEGARENRLFKRLLEEIGIGEFDEIPTNFSGRIPKFLRHKIERKRFLL